MDKVVEAVETVKKEWDDAYGRAKEHIKAIEEYGKSREEQNSNSNSLLRLNGLAQDALALLSSLQFRLDLLAPQFPTDDQVQSATALLDSWKNQSHNLRQCLRNATFQAKANMRKTAQEERELLLGGGGESTIRRRNLQTKAGMTSAAESITDSLRRTRQLMLQEVERIASTLMTVEESTGVLKKAESDANPGPTLYNATSLLFFMLSQSDTKVAAKGYYCQKSWYGMVGQAKIGDGAVTNGINDNAVHRVDVPLDKPMRDEL